MQRRRRLSRYSGLRGVKQTNEEMPGKVKRKMAITPSAVATLGDDSIPAGSSAHSCFRLAGNRWLPGRRLIPPCARAARGIPFP